MPVWYVSIEERVCRITSQPLYCHTHTSKSLYFCDRKFDDIARERQHRSDPSFRDVDPAILECPNASLPSRVKRVELRSGFARPGLGKDMITGLAALSASTVCEEPAPCEEPEYSSVDCDEPEEDLSCWNYVSEDNEDDSGEYKIEKSPEQQNKPGARERQLARAHSEGREGRIRES